MPLISGHQLVNWLDGRNNASFQNISWSGNTLSFNVNSPTFGIHANWLKAMVPAHAGLGNVTGVTLNGAALPWVLQTIKGMDYAVFDAQQGAIVVSYTSDTTAPTLVSTSPLANATNVASNTVVTATFSEPMNPATISGGTFELRTAGNVLVPATVTYDSGTNTARLTPTSLLTPAATFTARVIGGTSGMKDATGNPLGADNTWSFTTVALNCPCSIWADTATPATPAGTDGYPITVGTKFNSDYAGYITSLRFYKGAANTGPHVGRLWNSTGTLLAEVAFTNETASGWQVQALPTPAAINANTTYVVSSFRRRATSR